MVKEWSTYIRASGELGIFSSEHSEMLADVLYKRGGAVGSSRDGSWISAQFTVRATSIYRCFQSATEMFEKALAEIGVHDFTLDHVQLMTHEELEQELSRPLYPELVGIHEIAELLGVTRQRASALAASAQFPRPLTKIAAGPVWPRPWITRFLREWDRRPVHKGRSAKTAH